MSFAVPADHSKKIKESEKINKYLNPARESFKNLWNIKMTVIPVVVCALGTVPKKEKRPEELKIRERIATTQVLKHEKTCCHTQSIEKTQEFLKDFETLTDHLISDRLPDLVIINKKKKEN